MTSKRSLAPCSLKSRRSLSPLPCEWARSWPSKRSCVLRPTSAVRSAAKSIISAFQSSAWAAQELSTSAMRRSTVSAERVYSGKASRSCSWTRSKGHTGVTWTTAAGSAPTSTSASLSSTAIFLSFTASVRASTAPRREVLLRRQNSRTRNVPSSEAGLMPMVMSLASSGARGETFARASATRRGSSASW